MLAIKPKIFRKFGNRRYFKLLYFSSLIVAILLICIVITLLLNYRCGCLIIDLLLLCCGFVGVVLLC